MNYLQRLPFRQNFRITKNYILTTYIQNTWLKVNRKTPDWKKYLENIYLTKDWISRIEDKISTTSKI